MTFLTTAALVLANVAGVALAMDGPSRWARTVGIVLIQSTIFGMWYCDLRDDDAAR